MERQKFTYQKEETPVYGENKVETKENFSGYLHELSSFISHGEMQVLNECFRKDVAGKMVEWRSVCLFMRLIKNFRNE